MKWGEKNLSKLDVIKSGKEGRKLSSSRNLITVSAGDSYSRKIIGKGPSCFRVELGGAQ